MKIMMKEAWIESFCWSISFPWSRTFSMNAYKAYPSEETIIQLAERIWNSEDHK